MTEHTKTIYLWNVVVNNQISEHGTGSYEAKWYSPNGNFMVRQNDSYTDQVRTEHFLFAFKRGTDGTYERVDHPMFKTLDSAIEWCNRQPGRFIVEEQNERAGIVERYANSVDDIADDYREAVQCLMDIQHKLDNLKYKFQTSRETIVAMHEGITSGNNEKQFLADFETDKLREHVQQTIDRKRDNFGKLKRTAHDELTELLKSFAPSPGAFMVEVPVWDDEGNVLEHKVLRLDELDEMQIEWLSEDCLKYDNYECLVAIQRFEDS